MTLLTDKRAALVEAVNWALMAHDRAPSPEQLGEGVVRELGAYLDAREAEKTPCPLSHVECSDCRQPMRAPLPEAIEEHRETCTGTSGDRGGESKGVATDATSRRPDDPTEAGISPPTPEDEAGAEEESLRRRTPEEHAATVQTYATGRYPVLQLASMLAIEEDQHTHALLRLTACEARLREQTDIWSTAIATYNAEHARRAEVEAKLREAEGRYEDQIAYTTRAQERLNGQMRRAEEAEAAFAACAHAIGIEHAPDTGPTAPGPVEAVVAAIENARRAEGALVDAREVALRAEARVADLEHDAGDPWIKDARETIEDLRTKLREAEASASLHALLGPANRELTRERDEANERSAADRAHVERIWRILGGTTPEMGEGAAARVVRERDEATQRVGQAVVTSLTNLRWFVAGSAETLGMWKDDPVAMLDVAIDTIRQVHVEGKVVLEPAPTDPDALPDRLIREGKEAMVRKVVTVREAARQRRPLDGSDAKALEHALTITERERDEAERRGYQRAVGDATRRILDTAPAGPSETWTHCTRACATEVGRLCEPGPPPATPARLDESECAWLIERNDVHLCYSQDGSSCSTWVTFTDPAAWRFESRAAAEATIAERDLLHCRAVEHGWPKVPARLDESRTAEPKTRLEGRAHAGDRIGPGSVVADTHVDNETGKRTGLGAEATAPAGEIRMSPVCLDPSCPHRGHRTCPHAVHHFTPVPAPEPAKETPR